MLISDLHCLLKANDNLRHIKKILLEMTVPLVDAVLMEVAETAAMEATVTKEGWILRNFGLLRPQNALKSRRPCQLPGTKQP